MGEGGGEYIISLLDTGYRQERTWIDLRTWSWGGGEVDYIPFWILDINKNASGMACSSNNALGKIFPTVARL